MTPSCLTWLSWKSRAVKSYKFPGDDVPVIACGVERLNRRSKWEKQIDELMGCGGQVRFRCRRATLTSRS